MTSTLVFVDSRVQEWQALVPGIHSAATVVVLSPSEDGLDQIASGLSKRFGIQGAEDLGARLPGRDADRVDAARWLRSPRASESAVADRRRAHRDGRPSSLRLQH